MAKDIAGFMAGQISNNSHTTLSGRDKPDQHPIESITKLTEALTALRSLISDEETRAKSAESSLDKKTVDEINKNLEAITRISNKLTVFEREYNDRLAQEDVKLEYETENRIEEDSKITNRLETEENTRLAKDTTLQKNIDNTNKNLSDETDRATKSEEDILDRIDDEVARWDANLEQAKKDALVNTNEVLRQLDVAKKAMRTSVRELRDYIAATRDRLIGSKPWQTIKRYVLYYDGKLAEVPPVEAANEEEALEIFKEKYKELYDFRDPSRYYVKVSPAYPEKEDSMADIRDDMNNAFEEERAIRKETDDFLKKTIDEGNLFDSYEKGNNNVKETIDTYRFPYLVETSQSVFDSVEQIRNINNYPEKADKNKNTNIIKSAGSKREEEINVNIHTITTDGKGSQENIEFKVLKANQGKSWTLDNSTPEFELSNITYTHNSPEYSECGESGVMTAKDAFLVRDYYPRVVKVLENGENDLINWFTDEFNTDLNSWIYDNTPHDSDPPITPDN